MTRSFPGRADVVEIVDDQTCPKTALLNAHSMDKHPLKIIERTTNCHRQDPAMIWECCLAKEDYLAFSYNRKTPITPSFVSQGRFQHLHPTTVMKAQT
jgi:hypothetical protein